MTILHLCTHASSLCYIFIVFTQTYHIFQPIVSEEIVTVAETDMDTDALYIMLEEQEGL